MSTISVDSETDALIIADVQNDFCPGGALAVPYGDEVVPVINRLLEHRWLSVATMDWHPAEHCSFRVPWRPMASALRAANSGSGVASRVGCLQGAACHHQGVAP
jgi:nicotinamidase/pyrazinamidase